MGYSIRDMAAALGVSKSQIARDKADGMPMDGPDTARAWRLAHRDVSRAVDGRLTTGAQPAATPVAQKPAAAGASNGDASDADDDEGADVDAASYRQSRAEKEKIRVQRERMELDRDLGRLVDADEVARLRFTEFRALRDALGNVALRVKDQLAAESDPMRCETIVSTELNAVLAAFADQVLKRGILQDADDDDDEPA